MHLPKLSCWLDVKVFYVRVGNCEVQESSPKHLMLNYILLAPDIVVEMNGRRSNSYTECVSCVLRRDRVDKRSEEATFVSTDSISINGSVRFELYLKDAMLLSGVLELSSDVNQHETSTKRWRMKCQQVISSVSTSLNFFKGKYQGSDVPTLPLVELYSGAPVVLTRSLQIKQQKKLTLDSIPEYEFKSPQQCTTYTLLLSKYDVFAPEQDADIDYYKSMYSREKYWEGEDEDEDGEPSWFNAGVRVSVDLGLGICLGVGVGVGLLVSATRNFKRRLI